MCIALGEILFEPKPKVLQIDCGASPNDPHFLDWWVFLIQSVCQLGGGGVGQPHLNENCNVFVQKKLFQLFPQISQKFTHFSHFGPILGGFSPAQRFGGGGALRR